MSHNFAREHRNPLDVIIITRQYRVVGTMHIVPGTRITDCLSAYAKEGFVPITDVKVYSLTDSALILESKFMDLNADAIIFTYPAAEQINVTL
jgi:hypothetical protein